MSGVTVCPRHASEHAWPYVARKLTEALAQNDKQAVNGILSLDHFRIESLSLAGLQLRKRLSMVDEAMMVSAAPFTSPLVRSIESFIDEGKSVLISARRQNGSTVRFLSDDAVRHLSQVRDPDLRVHLYSEAFAKEMRIPAIEVFESLVRKPLWGGVSEVLKQLRLERARLYGLFYQENASLLEPFDDNIDVSFPPEVANIFAAIPLKEMAAKAVLHLAVDSAMTVQQVHRALQNSQFDLSLARSHSGAALLALRSILAGCNDACSSIDRAVIENESVHGERYINYFARNLQRFFNEHVDWIPESAFEEFFVLDSQTGRLSLKDFVWRQRPPGYPPATTLDSLSERGVRKHMCPAVLSPEFMLFGRIFAEPMCHPVIVDYGLEVLSRDMY